VSKEQLSVWTLSKGGVSESLGKQGEMYWRNHHIFWYPCWYLYPLWAHSVD